MASCPSPDQVLTGDVVLGHKRDPVGNSSDCVPAGDDCECNHPMDPDQSRKCFWSEQTCNILFEAPNPLFGTDCGECGKMQMSWHYQSCESCSCVYSKCSLSIVRAVYLVGVHY